MVGTFTNVTAALLLAIHGAECDFAANPPAGDHGRALGVLQIQVSVVRDVNRIYKTHYKHTDALSPKKSIEMARLYLGYWGGQYQKKTGKVPTDEVLARIWNGGPTGWREKATKRYWIARVLPNWGKDRSIVASLVET